MMPTRGDRARPCPASRRARYASALLAPLIGALALAAPAGAAAPAPPTASTQGVSAVTFSSAVLHGSVNPRGQSTNYFFQYGPTKAYGAQTPLAPAGAGSTSVAVSQAVTGLQAATTYHYRLIAVGPGGAANGSDRSFTTPKIPLSLQIAGVPNPVTFGSPFTLEGTLSGTGAANHAIVLQANPFPYLGGFKTVGNPELTNSVGGFAFPVLGLLENAQVRVVTVGKPEVSSPTLIESVAVSVTFHVRPTRRRGFVRLYGTVFPAEVGALVGFQRLIPGGRTVNMGGTVVRGSNAKSSRFSRIVRLRKRGLYRALVKVNDGAHVSAYSAPIAVR
jgi:hypothetical protein